jgi:hypothetical protein
MSPNVFVIIVLSHGRRHLVSLCAKCETKQKQIYDEHCCCSYLMHIPKLSSGFSSLLPGPNCTRITNGVVLPAEKRKLITNRSVVDLVVTTSR